MLLAGTDEENGSADLEYYRKNHTLPSMVITPDASYPVINGEKGMLRFLLQRKVSQTYLSEVTGGEVINGVPQNAEAEFVFVPPFWSTLPDQIGEVRFAKNGQKYYAHGKNAMPPRRSWGKTLSPLFGRLWQKPFRQGRKSISSRIWLLSSPMERRVGKALMPPVPIRFPAD